MFVAFLVVFVFWKLALSTGCPNKCQCFRSGLKAGEVFCQKLAMFPAMDDFPQITTHLVIIDSSFSEVPTEQLYKLKELRTLSITHSSLKRIGAFTNSGDSKLTILLLNNNEISSIEDGAFDDLKELVQINLDNNRLETFPVFRKPLPLKKLFLNGNSIKSLFRSSLKNLAKLNSLALENAQLTELPANIFDKNQDLWHLNLKHSALETINDNAFTDSSLQELLLDETKITAIPRRGLEKLKRLSLKNVKNFWSIPAGLKRIREVYVSKYNSFLCCAFVLKKYQRDFARQREPEGVVTSSYAPSASSRSTGTQPKGVVTSSYAPSASPSTRPSVTSSKSKAPPSTSSSATTFVYSPTTDATAPTTTACLEFCRRKRRDESGSGTTGMPPTTGQVPRGSNGTSRSPTSVHSGGLTGFLDSLADPVTPPATQEPGNGGGSFTGFPGGILTGSVTVPRTQHHVNQTNDSLVTEPPFEDVICLPESDAYHPCEDIMGAKWLTAVSLMVGSVALLANLVVVVVVLSSERRFNVNRFLMSNLAFADFFLGLYLFVVVCVSLNTSGEYYNHVKSWQHGVGCQMAGFFAVFSTELSVYTLTVITIERFLAIVYAMQVNTRLSFRAAARAMMSGWLLALFLAILPLVGVNSYQDVAICLPFNSDTSGSLAYVVTILVLNFTAFVVIALLYGKMFRVVMDTGPTEGGPQRNDAKVAKRMSLLVFTDFVCWLPIAFFGLVAAFGRPLIGIEESKFLLVFFFPLNSFCNPFLYAFFTKAFKREFFSLLSRFGFCHTRALHHKGTLISLIYSRSRTKRSTVVEDDRDTKSKRVSQVSATGPKLGNSFFNVTGDRNPSPSHENVPMTGLSNPAYAVESPVTANNERMFFEKGANNGASSKQSSYSERYASLEAPQLPRAISASSINGIDGPAVEKRTKKLSVSFGDDPRLRVD